MIKYRILVIEKEEEIQKYLQDDNFNIVSCTTLECENCRIERQSVDAIILDMKSYDKTDIFKYISDNSHISIYVANAEAALKYQLYECGAYDVLPTPLDKLELKYKINIAVQKNKYIPKKYLIGDLLYEVETGTLIKGKKSIVLPTLQNKIFALLLNGYYENRIVKKEEVFNSMIDESSRIQNHIARLRFSLNYISSRHVVIETVYGKGYKLIVMDR
ncbi:MAG: winged helix-turn-helix domain-containing protein [Eubacteriales bacterium]